jgi:uncharacterized membrane protein YhaH (DUF805 family)
MLGFLFGFNARLPRLIYVLASLVLVGVMAALCYGISSYVFQRTNRVVEFSYEQASAAALAAAAFFMWVIFTLQSMRIRDIGWDPVCVIPLWTTVLIIDHVVAGKMPGLAITEQHQTTVIGVVANVGLLLVLGLWPSGEQGVTTGASADFHDDANRLVSGSAPASRLAHVMGQASSHRKY